MRSSKAASIAVLSAALIGAPVLQSAQAATSTPVIPKVGGRSSTTVFMLSQPASSAAAAIAAQAAASAVSADPLLGGEHQERYLRFKDVEAKKKKDEKARKEFSSWWLDLLTNMGTGLRIAMWLIGAALFVWVLLRLRDWLRLRGGAPTVAAVAPTHVGSLDIRPESLPADIGAAARALWQRGESRAALSLLYRGALSRLVHAHAVPIRAASTESDCLTLAEPRLAPSAHRFLSQLVAGWQTVAYAGRSLDDADFEPLCAGFDAQLTPGGRA